MNRISLALCADLAALLRYGMERNGWTRKKLSMTAHVCQGSISRILSGRMNPTLDMTGKLLAAIGCECKGFHEDFRHD